tara:strand:- start:75 stop:1343 length:1269 start_codon:yes stop_codon:yes gene_type:complete
VKDGRYKIVSLKTTDKSHAIELAMQKWKEFSQHVDSGGTVFEKKTQDIIDEYVSYLEKLVEIEQVKKITIQSKKTSIVKLRELVSPYETPSKIPHNFLKDYVLWRRTKNWDRSKHKNNPKPPTDRTINKELQDIQGWINWCIDQKYVGSYLMRDIKVDYQRIDNKKTIEKNPSFTYEDWMKLVVYMRTWIKTEITLKGNEKKNMFYRKVTRLLLLILGNTGMRLHESLSLTWRDVEVITKKGIGKKSGKPFVRYGVRIQIPPDTKTGSREVVCQGGQYFIQLKELYKEKIGHFPKPDQPLFMNAGTLTSKKDDFYGKPLSGSFFRRLWYELRDEMRELKGIEFFNNYTLHSCRAWFINEKLASGIPPSVVGQIVGHSLKVMETFYKNIEVRSLTEDLIKVRFRNLQDSDFEIYDFDNGEVTV